MLVDFHTHSTASDGAMAPAALLQRALERGVGMLAITDHDTVDGYLQARADARADALRLVERTLDGQLAIAGFAGFSGRIANLF